MVSTTTLARIARRPSLLSKIAPRSSLPSTIASTTHACRMQPRAGLLEQLDRLVLQPLRVDHRRPRDDVAEGAQALAPVGDRLGLPRAPLLLGRAGDGVGRQALEDLRGEAGDDLAPFPVAHPVDPDDEAAGGEPAEVVVALDERDLGAEPARRHRGRAAGGAAADDEHVGLLVDRASRARARGSCAAGRASSGSAGRSVPSMNQLSRPVWYWSTSCLGAPPLSLMAMVRPMVTRLRCQATERVTRVAAAGEQARAAAARPRRAAARRPARRAFTTQAVCAWRRRRGSPSGRTSACSVRAGRKRPHSGQVYVAGFVFVARRTTYQRASEKCASGDVLHLGSRARPPGPPRIAAPTDRAGEERPRAA